MYFSQEMNFVRDDGLCNKPKYEHDVQASEPEMPEIRSLALWRFVLILSCLY